MCSLMFHIYLGIVYLYQHTKGCSMRKFWGETFQTTVAHFRCRPRISKPSPYACGAKVDATKAKIKNIGKKSLAKLPKINSFFSRPTRLPKTSSSLNTVSEFPNTEFVFVFIILCFQIFAVSVNIWKHRKINVFKFRKHVNVANKLFQTCYPNNPEDLKMQF